MLVLYDRLVDLDLVDQPVELYGQLDGHTVVKTGARLRVIGDVSAALLVEPQAYVEIIGRSSGRIVNFGTVWICGGQAGMICNQGWGRSYVSDTVPEVIDAELIAGELEP